MGLKIDTLYMYFSVVLYYKDSNILVFGRPRAVACWERHGRGKGGDIKVRRVV